MIYKKSINTNSDHVFYDTERILVRAAQVKLKEAQVKSKIMSKKSIEIWLDDERDPKDKFIQERFGADPGMTWVKTAAEAILLLKSADVTFISFDHDLGVGGSGYDVAKWLEQSAYRGYKRIQWHVHSMNTVGCQNMLMALKKCEDYWNQHDTAR